MQRIRLFSDSALYKFTFYIYIYICISISIMPLVFHSTSE